MSAAAILQRLERVGVRARADGGRVLLAPRERVTPDVLELVRANKPALIEALLNPPRLAHASLELRRSRVERELAEHSERRVAFDVIDAPIKAEPGRPISVMLAVRHGEHILSGELRIPRQRWDMTLFLRTVDPGQKEPA